MDDQKKNSGPQGTYLFRKHPRATQWRRRMIHKSTDSRVAPGETTLVTAGCRSQLFIAALILASDHHSIKQHDSEPRDDQPDYGWLGRIALEIVGNGSAAG
jgi:hypothetical protein